MTPALRGALLAVVAAPLFAACSSSPPPAEPVPTADTPPPPPPEITAEPPPAQTEAPGLANPAGTQGPQGRELTPSDCQALASRYGEVTRSDELAKLPEKLSPAQKDQARAAIDKAAQQLGQNWQKGCAESLVGKVASEENVQCAMTAKTVSAFDMCLNGGGAR